MRTIIKCSGGSSKQARAVLDGLEADVVTMNQDTDINVLAKGGLLPENWRTLLPNNSAPYSSTIVFLVRKANPKGYQGLDDLVKPGISLIIPNPELRAMAAIAISAPGHSPLANIRMTKPKVREFVAALFKNVPVLEAGGRAATNTFVQKGNR